MHIVAQIVFQAQLYRELIFPVLLQSSSLNYIATAAVFDVIFGSFLRAMHSLAHAFR